MLIQVQNRDFSQINLVRGNNTKQPRWGVVVFFHVQTCECVLCVIADLSSINKEDIAVSFQTISCCSIQTRICPLQPKDYGAMPFCSHIQTFQVTLKKV